MFLIRISEPTCTVSARTSADALYVIKCKYLVLKYTIVMQYKLRKFIRILKTVLMCTVTVNLLTSLSLAWGLTVDSSQMRFVFLPPVQALISDPFRAPDNPYGPGNRGIEYVTRDGDIVRASAAGSVSFAGPVAGELYITINHGGGLLSSYSYLGRINVAKSAMVNQGDVIGFAGSRFLHFSIRMNGEYVDPVTFIGVLRTHIRLVRYALASGQMMHRAGAINVRSMSVSQRWPRDSPMVR